MSIAIKPTLRGISAELHLEKLSPILERAAYWMRFSRWYADNRTESFEPYIYEKRYKLYEKLIETEQLNRAPLDYLEFGVYKGESIEWWTKHISDRQSRFFGFDTFEGLPRDWNSNAKAGTFATGKIPQISDVRCQMIVGRFEKTVHEFLSSYQRRARILAHLDADIYSSTIVVLTAIFPYLQPGDLLMFDEFSSPVDEFRAFQAFVSSFEVRYQIAGSINNFNQVCFRIL